LGPVAQQISIRNAAFCGFSPLFMRLVAVARIEASPRDLRPASTALLTTDIGDAGGNADRGTVVFIRVPRSFVAGAFLFAFDALLYYGFRSATPSATVFSAIHTACSM